MSAMLARVNTLPPEVLSQIFVCAMPGLTDSLGKIQIPHPANVIASVCSRWHQVSIATSSLWSCINIIRAESDKRHRKFLKLMGIWLKRSKTAPLHLHIASTGSHDYAEYTKKILSLVQPHIPRIATLQLHRTSQDLCVSLMKSYYNSNGRVTLVDLRIEGDFSSRQVSASPQQRQPESFPFIWPLSVLSRLSRLELRHIPADFMPVFNGFVAVLSNMPALQCLKLEDVRFSGEMDGEYPFIVMPDIEALAIEPSSGRPYLQKLVSILKPGLRHLAVHLGSWFHEPTRAIFPHANVTFLRVCNLHAIDALGLGHALDYCTQLKSLELGCYNLHSILEVLVKRNQEDTIARCPNLKRLKLHACTFSPPAIEQLKRVVQVYDLIELEMDTPGVSDEVRNDEVLIEWLCQRVETVSVGDRSFQRIHDE
ncbi:pyrolysin [Ceratobasidium sp. AG-Ba]|nr:pyrolysin [Ceratobasidium sp. AG-Ba]